MTDLRAIFSRLSLFNDGGLLTELQVKQTWMDQIQDKQLGDESLSLRFCQIEGGCTSDFGLNKDRVLCFRGQICMLNDSCLRQSILRECEVPDFVARCLTCQQVKTEHQLPLGLLQPVKIPLWKWEQVTRDFVSGFPLTPTKKDFLWVIMD
ncbi:uncharacterized protein LOC128283965 [Gossypium arboreum]|uniref:uncharacterized protein LOC128283965 n=1 Tax=Gossypium arboreum TaxID=29729 RepID=UPI0022F1802A|nr:uncharacterized protein LOC128283965 [Gossypium arboreum]